MNQQLMAALPALLCVSAAAVVMLAAAAWVARVSYRARQMFKNIEAARQASQTWPTTTGTVIKSRVEVRGGSRLPSVIPLVEYEYEVRGRVYRSDQLRAVDRFAPRKLGRDSSIATRRGRASPFTSTRATRSRRRWSGEAVCGGRVSIPLNAVPVMKIEDVL